MKVFISWSGQISKALAEALHRWLPLAIQSIDPWLSAEDVAKGARWGAELAHQLEATRFGIICVTPDNLTAPWLLFEAGALSKTTHATFVCPYLFKLESTELTGPLAQFQATPANRDGTRRLLQTLNSASGEPPPLSEKKLDITFDQWWPKLDSELQEVAKTSIAPARPARTEQDMLKEILELVRNMNRRPYSREEDAGSSKLLVHDLVRGLEDANTLLRADKTAGMPPRVAAGELAERLPAVLQRSVSARKRAKRES